MERSNIQTTIRSSSSEIVALASQLISIPSTTGEEGAISKYISDLLAQWGFKVETFDVDPEALKKRYPNAFTPFLYPYEGRPNVVARFQGSGGGRSLMINFHMDTVPANPAKWTFNPWKATVKDGMLHGRGACDMKGGTAAALFAVKTILESGIRLRGDIILAGVVEEEGPGMGALAVQARGVRADACLVPEPTGMTITTGVTGGVYGYITVSGKSAHATSPWNGVNAIEKAYVVLEGLQAWRKLRRQISVDPLYALNPDTPAAACVTDIARSDGGSMGMLPWTASIRIRATVMPGENPNDIARNLTKTILGVTEKDPWLSKNPPVFALQIWGGRSYPASLPQDHALSRTLSESFSRIIGKKPEFTGLVSPADMQIIMNIEPSTPALMFGPGDLKQAHADDEGVPIEELCLSSVVISDFILNWCK